MNALVATTLLLASLLAAAPVLAADALWAALRGGGHVALMRHATAPGVGDPDGFKVEDCATQRNLSAVGRDEARRIGERFGRRVSPPRASTPASGAAASIPRACWTWARSRHSPG